MKQYRLKHNSWTLKVLPVSICVLGALIVLGIVFGDYFTVADPVPFTP